MRTKKEKTTQGMLPCPICGKPPLLVRGEGILSRPVYFVMCFNNNCEGNPATADEKLQRIAIKRWNARITTMDLFSVLTEDK